MKRIVCIILCLLALWGCGASETQAPTHPTQPPFSLPENPYGPEDFAWEGDYLTCISGQAMLGIDVSHWQGDVDWQQVKAAGIEFVMIRLGQRGAVEGKLSQDSRAREYYEGASAAGLKIGAYFFSQAITPQEAVEEAEYALEMVKDWNLEMPLVYDWEHYAEDGRTLDITGRMLTDCTVAFCDTVREAGYTPMVYFNRDQARRLKWTDLADYPLWLAMYDQDMSYPYRVDMWQYTSSGSVPGISGNVDINLYFTYGESS